MGRVGDAPRDDTDERLQRPSNAVSGRLVVGKACAQLGRGGLKLRWEPLEVEEVQAERVGGAQVRRVCSATSLVAASVVAASGAPKTKARRGTTRETPQCPRGARS